MKKLATFGILTFCFHSSSMAGPKAELWQKPKGEAIGKDFIQASASSTLCEKKKKQKPCHQPKMLLDGNLKTAWCEGKPGFGKGAKLTFVFDSEVELIGFTVVPHFAKDFRRAIQNARAKELEIQAADKSFIVVLEDLAEKIRQENGEKAYSGDEPCGDETCSSRDERIAAGEFLGVSFKEAIVTKELNMILKDVHKGKRYKDTCISEIRFYKKK